MERFILDNKYIFNCLLTMYEWVDEHYPPESKTNERYEVYEFRDEKDFVEWYISNQDLEIMF